MARVERPDLQDGWRDALALIRAFLDPDPDRKAQAFRDLLSIYPDGADELVFPLLGLLVMNAGSIDGLSRFVEIIARLEARV